MANFKTKKDAEKFLNAYNELYEISKSDFSDDVSFCILETLQVYKNIEHLAKLLNIELNTEHYKSPFDERPMMRKSFRYGGIKVMQLYISE